MSSGTITVTNKSDKVVGVGTTFTTDLKAGDVMVMPVGTGSFTLIVKSIESATGLTLMEPFRGPTLSGQSWSAVPYETMLRINAQLSTQTGIAIYGLNLDKQNWQAVFSESGDITITLPDLTTFTGPSWKKIADLLEGLDPTQLQATADQVHADAQQVATDKTEAQTAATTATQAKTDAQTAQGLAETAAAGSASSEAAAAQHASDASGDATAAAASATEAANYAASIHPENLLHKDQNLDDLADKSAARGHLDVYSKSETYGKTEIYGKTETYSNTEIDAKNTATNARIGYALLLVTNPALGSRTVITNPFGNSVPVITKAEYYHTTLLKWINAEWQWTSSSFIFGMTASYSEGEGIVLRIAGNSYSTTTSTSGASQEFTAHAGGAITPSLVRIHVWKVTA